MTPEKDKIRKDIEVAKENIESDCKKTDIEDITESLDNSPIWPAENEKEAIDGDKNCKREGESG